MACLCQPEVQVATSNGAGRQLVQEHAVQSKSLRKHGVHRKMKPRSKKVAKDNDLIFLLMSQSLAFLGGMGSTSNNLSLVDHIRDHGFGHAT
jgi:hypothetical protein